jgi:hypothetical protein
MQIMSNGMKEFRLEMPRFVIAQEIPPQILEDPEETEKFLAWSKIEVEKQHREWLQRSFDAFFKKEIEVNKERWKKDEYSFGEKLIHQID